ncbi:FAD-binding protein [Vibrio lentus]|nr:FAD-binding protein [Vibrio lentus]
MVRRQSYRCLHRNRNQEHVETVRAKFMVLATGGASKEFTNTLQTLTSLQVMSIAIAWRAGCRVAEHRIQPIPPNIYSTQKRRNFLLTEALRGEGAYLRRPDGSKIHEGLRRAW